MQNFEKLQQKGARFQLNCEIQITTSAYLEANDETNCRLYTSIYFSQNNSLYLLEIDFVWSTFINAFFSFPLTDY